VLVAKIIATAGVRLQADDRGLSTSISNALRKAVKDGSKDIHADIPGFSDGKIEKDADHSASGLKKVFGDLFSFIGDSGSKAASAAFSGSRLLLMGAAAGTAIAGVSALSAGLIALVGAAAQAGGAVGILPAVFVALKAITTTVQLGLANVKDTFAALASGDVDAFNASLKKLAPNAKAFVQEAAKFKGVFDSMQMEVQNRLFADFAGIAIDLGENVLPIAGGLFTRLASEINVAAKEIVGLITTTGGLDSLETTSTNIVTGFSKLRQAAVPVTQAVLDIVTAGSTQLPRLGQAVATVSGRFQEFISRAASSGNLEQFFSKSLDVASQLGRILGNLAGALGNVFVAGQTVGGGLLNTLEKITQAFQDWTDSAAGNTALQTFFGSVATVGEQLLPIIATLATAFGSGLAPILSNLATSIGPGVAAVVAQLLPTFQALGPGVSLLGQAFGSVLVALAPLLPALGQVVGQIAVTLAQALTAILPYITQFVAAFAESPGKFIAIGTAIFGVVQAVGPLFSAISTLAPIMSTLGPIFSELLGSAGGLKGIFTALTGPVGIAIALFVALFTGSEDFRNAVIGLLTTIGQFVGQLLSALKPALDALIGAVGPLIAQLGTALAPVITLVTNLLGSILPPVIAALIPIIDALVPVINLIAETFSVLIAAAMPVIDLFVSLLMPVIEALLPIVTTVFTAVADIITNTMTVVKGIIDVVLGIITGDWDRAWKGLGEIVSGAIDLIKSIISGIFNILVSIVVNGWNAIKGFFTAAWNGIGDIVSNGISSVIDFVSGLGGKILSALGNFGQLLLDAGSNLIGGLIDGIKSAAGRIADAVLGPIKDTIKGVKNLLGIASPSKLFRQFGGWVGEGFALGIEALTPRVASAGSDMVGALATSGLTPGVGLGSLSSGGGSTGPAPSGGGVTVNQQNVMLPGTNVRQFANEVLRNSAQALATGNTVLSVGQGSVQNGMAAPDTFFGGAR
jgi:phage-related protein